MALEITQRPGVSSIFPSYSSSLNSAYTRMAYVVSESNINITNAPQFRYIMDIYEAGGSDLIHRTTQTPNPQNVAVFDPSRVLQAQVEFDNNWEYYKVTTGTNYDPGVIMTSSLSNKRFDIKFAKQSGSSPSSSVSETPYEETLTMTVFPSTHNLNLQSNVNWNSGSNDNPEYSGWNFPVINFLPSFDTNLVTSSNPYFMEDSFLTNNPFIQKNNRQTFYYNNPGDPRTSFTPRGPLVKYSDYMTISHLTNECTTAQFELLVDVYSGSTVVGSGSIPPLNFASPQPVYVERGIGHIGIGPQNLIGWLPAEFGFMTGSNTWTHIDHQITFRCMSTVSQSISLRLENEDYYKQETSTYNNDPQPENVCDERIRFAFINNFGVYDYYNIYNPVRKISELKRESVNLNQLSYSGLEAPYESSQRGEKDFYVNRQDRFIVTTDWLTQPVAQWLEELMESPSVYVQESTGFLPITITNSRVQKNLKQSRNKLFQYTIEFEYSNKRLGTKTSPLGQS
jgi:hypothetical protein